MHTELVSESDIDRVIEVLKQGEIVAVPTETVYGLAAVASDVSAVKKIFIAKNRPADNPLIVHVDSVEEALKLFAPLPSYAVDLAKQFWPGPLTIIGSSAVSWPHVQAGHETIAVRVPSHPFLRSLANRAGPIAAPSANVSGRPSATSARACVEDFDGVIPLIVDGGLCDHGVESTIVDCTKDRPVIVRPGALTREEIELVVGRVDTNSSVASPGTRYAHYKPRAQVLLVDEIPQEYSDDTLYILSQKIACKHVRAYASVQELAKQLFAWLRLADELKCKQVVVQSVPEEGLGVAVMNRLRKAAHE